jgi:hypothetical protein
MDPATTIILKLGGEAKVAGIAGTALSAPYRVGAFSVLVVRRQS